MIMLPAFDNGYSLLYDDYKGMMENSEKAIKYCNCNAFYNNFDYALKCVMNASNGDIKNSLKVNIDFKGKTLIKRLEAIYEESMGIKEQFESVNIPNKDWYYAVYSMIMHRIKNVKDWGK